LRCILRLVILFFIISLEWKQTFILDFDMLWCCCFHLISMLYHGPCNGKVYSVPHTLHMVHIGFPPHRWAMMPIARSVLVNVSCTFDSLECSNWPLATL
jgi:hypothetical protein